jgi:hypothetical protein
MGERNLILHKNLINSGQLNFGQIAASNIPTVMYRKMFLKIPILYGVVCLVAGGALAEPTSGAARALALQGTMGTYCHPPRLENGRADVRLLVEQLVDIHANTYSFCIHSGTNDWDDLQLFLPLARQHGIRVWGSIVPPSESPPRSRTYAEPFRLDYERWAVEFAKLSLRETNLTGWSIDDFSANLKTTYTPQYLKKMLEAARAINPRLAFVPCCYYKGINAAFVKNYQPLLDGILFPYRHESGGANLTDAGLVEAEVKKIKELTGPDFPIVIDVYATAHSRLGKSTPEYVRQVMTSGKNCADGVLIYCHQDPKLDPEKYQIIKELFGVWSPKD